MKAKKPAETISRVASPSLLFLSLPQPRLRSPQAQPQGHRGQSFHALSPVSVGILSDPQRRKINKNKQKQIPFENFTWNTKCNRVGGVGLIPELWGCWGCRTVESGFGRAPHTRQCATRASGCGLNEAFQQLHTASLVPLEGRFLEAKPSAGKSRDPWAICLSPSLKGKGSPSAVPLRGSLLRLGARGDRQTEARGPFQTGRKGTR